MSRALPALALLTFSAALQTVIFPVAGPLPAARAAIAWVALVPWFYVVLRCSLGPRRAVLRATLFSYFCGVLWYLGHCYWIYQTMHQYGGLSSFMAAVVLLLFCFYLAVYHACFGALLAFTFRHLLRRMPSVLSALLIAALWVAVELARARITSFPWNLLGYSQIDNAALTSLAPLAGVYLLSFVLAFANAGFSVAVFSAATNPDSPRPQQQPAIRRLSSVTYPALAGLLVAAVSLVAGLSHRAPMPPPQAQAIALQPVLDPSPHADAASSPLEQQLAAITLHAVRSAAAPTPRLILWPEAPTPFELHEALFQSTLTSLASAAGATVIADTNAVDSDSSSPRRARIYNSAALFTANGMHARYNKIHLVPFGEFVPYADLFQFAGGLTEQVGSFDRGTRRAPLSDGEHRYGTFICYESIFPEEVRQLALRGADVLVNLSDDGWYGDTSAPFQHSNMARMRAIENRRWLLRDTNNGITESIDSYGNIRAAALRNQRLAVALPYAYSTQLTFYTRYGDVFAWLCVAISLALTLYAASRPATHLPAIRSH